MPGMYAVTSTPFVRRTRATFRRAEFGFFGVTVRTTVQTPRRCGLPRRAGDFDFATTFRRPFLTSWLTVGIFVFRSSVRQCKNRPASDIGGRFTLAPAFTGAPGLAVTSLIWWALPP